MYAGFIRRSAAFVIDNIIVSIAGGLIGLAWGFFATLFFGTDRSLGFYLFSFLLGIAVNLCYFAIFESSSWQATPGKKALGIKVTDLNGQRISFARATGRWAGKFLSAAILYIGYLMCIWTHKKQCLQDIMAGCLVVSKDYQPTDGPVGTMKSPFWVWLLGLFVPLFACLLIAGITIALVLPAYFGVAEHARLQQTATLMNSISHSQQRQFMRRGQFARTYNELDIVPSGASGTRWQNGLFTLVLSGTGYSEGNVTAVRQNTSGSSPYELSRYYWDNHITCKSKDEYGAVICAMFCEIDSLAVNESCCTSGARGKCPPPVPQTR